MKGKITAYAHLDTNSLSPHWTFALPHSSLVTFSISKALFFFSFLFCGYPKELWSAPNSFLPALPACAISNFCSQINSNHCQDAAGVWPSKPLNPLPLSS